MMRGAARTAREQSQGLPPLAWPRVEPSALAAPAATPPPPVVQWIEAPAFAALAGPEATRLLGFRLSLRPTATPPAAAGPESLLAVAMADTGVGRLALGMDRHAIGTALERMFGASGLSGSSPVGALAALAPASGSWMAFAGLVADALGRALNASNLPCATPPSPVGRLNPLPAAVAQDCQWFALDVAGTAGWLALTRSPVAGRATAGHGHPCATPGEGEDQANGTTPAQSSLTIPLRERRKPVPEEDWQARAAALARTIELPVGVRIAELRLPLTDAMHLAVGSVLPIDRPRLLMLSVDGVPWRPIDAPHTQHGGQP